MAFTQKIHNWRGCQDKPGVLVFTVRSPTQSLGVPRNGLSWKPVSCFSLHMPQTTPPILTCCNKQVQYNPKSANMPQEERRRAPRSAGETLEQTLLTALAGLLNTSFGEKALPYALSSFQATVMSNTHIQSQKVPRNLQEKYNRQLCLLEIPTCPSKAHQLTEHKSRQRLPKGKIPRAGNSVRQYLSIHKDHNISMKIQQLPLREAALQ